MNRMIDNIGVCLYDKWLWNLRKGKTMECFFLDNFYSNIAIYGVGLIGMQILEELKNSRIHVCYCIDQNAQEKKVEGMDVIVPNLLGSISRSVDAIVVSPIQHFFDIEKKLLELLHDTDIISIEQVVEYVSRHG